MPKWTWESWQHVLDPPFSPDCITGAHPYSSYINYTANCIIFVLLNNLICSCIPKRLFHDRPLLPPPRTPLSRPSPSPPPPRFLIVGLDNAGKTSTLEAIKQTYTGERALPPNRIIPTVGLNIAKINTRGATNLFWDLGGQAALRNLWGKYYDEAHGCIFVVDSEDLERLEESRRVLHDICGDPALYGAPILILCNKQDTDRAASVTQIRTALQVEELVRAGNRTVTCVGGSALRSQGIREATSWLFDRAPAAAALRRSERNRTTAATTTTTSTTTTSSNNSNDIDKNSKVSTLSGS